METLVNDFSFGLFIMQCVILVILIFLMRKFAWKPILDSLNSREEEIEGAIEAAKSAKEEMAKLTANNEKLMAEARVERDTMLKDAKKVAETMVTEAKETASLEGEKMIAAAKEAIEIEKKAAMTEVKNQVAAVSLEVAEKLLRKELTSKDAQRDLVETLIGETPLN